MTADRFPYDESKLFISKAGYRVEIDGLRAFAITAVIINHFNKDLLPNGFLGVDIFFVISGYVITSSVITKEYTSFTNFLLEFYTRRVKRILPALIICILITYLAAICLITPAASDLFVIQNTGITALFGLSNLYLFNQATDYFKASTEMNLFTQTWSLGVEEQFYLIFPLFFLLSDFTKKEEQESLNRETKILIFVGLLSLISLCIYLWLMRFNQSAAYFLMPARFWELGFGCITFLAQRSQSIFPSVQLSISPIIITAIITANLFLQNIPIYVSTISIVVLTSCLIVNLNSNSVIFPIFTCKPIVFIGLISYSLYLWHWSILAISRWTIGIDGWILPIQVLLTVIISWSSYRYVEQGFRYSNWSKSQLIIIIYGIGISLLVSGLLYLVGNYWKISISNKEIPDFMRSTWWYDQNGAYIEYCHAKDKYADNLFKECVTNKREIDAKPNIYLFGDSHARNYLNGIQKAFPEYNVTYMTMGYGCAFMPENQISEQVESITSCREYVARVKEFVKNEIEANDVVFIGQLRDHQHDLGYEENILELARYSQNNSAKLVLLADVPGISIDPKSCIKRMFQREPETCLKSLDKVMLEQEVLNRIGNTLESKMANFRYLDVRQHLCTNQVCSLYKKELPLYHDYGHITDKASEMLAPFIREQLLDFLQL